MADTKIGPAPAGTEDTVRTHELLSIVPRKLTNRQRVELVRQAFPDKYEGFGEPEASKGRHTEYTGLQYADEIETLINASESRRSERRRKPCKYTWRCTEAKRGTLQWAKNQYRVQTDQEILDIAVDILIDHLTSKREAVNDFIVRGS